MRVYTDASTRNSISGLGYIATTSKHIEIKKSGMVIKQSDNNSAEMLAILYAIEDLEQLLQHNEKLIIFTDSTYAINAIRHNYYRPEEKPIVKKIQNILECTDYHLFWIKGHSKDGTVLSYFNKRADKMSKVTRKQYEKEQKRTKKSKKLLTTMKSKFNKFNELDF